MPFVQEEEILAWKGKTRGSKRGSSEELELDLIEVFEEDKSVLISSYLHTFVPSYSHIFLLIPYGEIAIVKKLWHFSYMAIFAGNLPHVFSPTKTFAFQL